MKTYKKISLLLLLSTTVAVNAFNPYDTSGAPSVDDFDDMSTPPRKEESILEKMVKEQAAPTKPTSAPRSVPLRTTSTNQETTAQKRERERQQQQVIKTAETYLGDAYIELSDAKAYHAAIQDLETTLTANQTTLANLPQARQFTKWEKILGGGAAVVGFIAAVKEAPEVLLLAVLTGAGTLAKYGLRQHSCNVTEATLEASKYIIEANINSATNSCDSYVTSVRTKLAALKSTRASLPEDLQERIDALENDFNTWYKTFSKA